MKEKVQQAIADMASKVSRDGRHVYTDNATGLKLQGVSSVSSIVPKDWLAAWGAKEAVKALGYSDYKNDIGKAVEILDRIKGIKTPEEWIAFLKEIKGASKRKSDKALVDGKAGHAWLETYVQAKIDKTPVPNVPEGNLTRPITQFLAWEAANVKEWVASEAYVCNLDKMYAGQLDSIYVSSDDQLILGDFKFAKFLGEDYYLQTAGYAACFESYDIEFDERVIIRLPKTLEREEWNEKEFKYEMKPNDMEVFRVPTRYKADRDAFYAALVVKGWINYATKL